MEPLNIQIVETGRLTPYARNAKLHPKDQIDKIARQITEVGFLVPIVADKELVVIAGHGRLEAAKALGLERVPVVIADHLSDDQAMAFRIADNKVAESPWDMQILAFELGTLERHEFDLTMAGISMEEARAALSTLAGPEPRDENQSSGTQEEPQSQKALAHTCPSCGFQFD